MGIVVRGTMVTLTLSKVRVHNHLLIYAYLFVVTSHILSWGPTCSQDLRAGTMGSEQARWDQSRHDGIWNGRSSRYVYLARCPL